MKFIGLFAIVAAAILCWAWLRQPSTTDHPALSPDATVSFNTKDIDQGAARGAGRTSAGNESQRSVLNLGANVDPEPSSADGTPIAIFGTVTTRDEDKTPIEQAVVRAYVKGARGIETEWLGETSTQSDGSYRIALWDKLEFPSTTRHLLRLHVRATKKGFAPRNSSIQIDQVYSGKRRLDVQLERGLHLEGLVREPSGRPAVGAQILFQSSSSGVSNYAFEETDDRGRFYIAVMDREPLSIVASKQGYAPFNRELKGWDLAQAPDVGELLLQVGGTLAGHIACAEGEPIGGIEVLATALGSMVQGRSTKATASCMTSMDGSFVLTGLLGPRWQIDVADVNFGVFSTGAADLELVFPGRVLSVLVEDSSGRALPGMAISAMAGQVASGAQDNGYWLEAYATGPDAIAAFSIPEAGPLVLQAMAHGQHPIQHVVVFPEKRCSWHEVLVIPSALPLGLVEIELHDPAGAPADLFDLWLETQLVNRVVYNLSGPGTYSVIEGTYRGTLVARNAREDYLLPITIEDIEVRQGQTVTLNPQLRLGGQLRLTVALDSLGKQFPPWATVHLLETNGRRRVRFFRGERQTDSNISPNSTSLADHVFAPGSAILEIAAKGYRTVRATVVILPGEITEHFVNLLPEDG